MKDGLTLAAGVAVLGFALFLIGLAVVIFAMPAVAERFLRAFASSAKSHYIEQGLRLVVGAALVWLAAAMRYPELFRAFGWLILITSTGLLLIPWRWHQAFSARAMPPIYRHIRVFALAVLTLAGLVLYGLGSVRW